MKKIKELKKIFVRRIAAVSDLHLMSRYSLCPPDFMSKEENPLLPNPGQIQLYNSWKSFCKTCDEWEVDTVLLAGDLVHGQNAKERGTGLMTTSTNEQITVAKKVLKPFLKDRSSHWVSGSGYHNTHHGMGIEEDICEQLKEAKYDAHWYGTVANLEIKPFGKIINLSHGGGSAAYYRETIAAREIIYGKAAQVNDKLPKIDMYVHGHYHWFCYMHQSNVHHLQLPSWIAYEPITLFTRNYTRYQPDIGGCLILFDHEGRITVWHFCYDLPHVTDFVRQV
jgi:hypothetical protein